MKKLLKLIAEQLRFGYMVEVFWDYDKGTDMYRESVSLSPRDDVVALLEKLATLPNRVSIDEVRDNWPKYEITLL